MELERRTLRYEEDYRKYGYSPLSLSMPSDRRAIRYHELVKNFPFFNNRDDNFTILDAGCGFGDLVLYLNYLECHNYSYIGVDVVESFIEEGEKRYGGGRDSKAKFYQYNFLVDVVENIEFDYAVSSQTFNESNLSVIKKFMSDMFYRSHKGISFNFVTDKVEFKKSGTVYHNPMEIMEYAYTITNCVIMDNACMPYECTCTMLKGGTDGLVYDVFREKWANEFKNDVFVVKEKDRK